MAHHKILHSNYMYDIHFKGKDDTNVIISTEQNKFDNLTRVYVRIIMNFSGKTTLYMHCSWLHVTVLNTKYIRNLVYSQNPNL